MILGQLNTYMQKNEVEPIPYAIYKTYIKMDRWYRSQKPYNHKTPKRQENLHDLGFGNRFLDMTPVVRQQKKN